MAKRVDWAKWDAMLGTRTDPEIARLIGCTTLAVGNRRRLLGIESLGVKRLAERVKYERPTACFMEHPTDAPCGIYVITNTANGRQYVGQSWQLWSRVNGHARNISIGEHPVPLIREDVAKYGAQVFRIEVVEVCRYAVLLDREAHWMRLLNPEYNRRGFDALTPVPLP